MVIHNKLIIIGSGPVGLTSSIYAARGGIDPLVISGNEPGGKLMYTTEVENFPGFDQPILGHTLMEKMRKQAKRFGSRFVNKAISSVDFSSKPFRVKCSCLNDNLNKEEYFTDSSFYKINRRFLALSFVTYLNRAISFYIIIIQLPLIHSNLSSCSIGFVIFTDSLKIVITL